MAIPVHSCLNVWVNFKVGKHGGRGTVFCAGYYLSRLRLRNSRKVFKELGYGI